MATNDIQRYNLVTDDAFAELQELLGSQPAQAAQSKIAPPPAQQSAIVDGVRPVFIKNTDSTDCPPGGCLAVIESFDTGDIILLKCAKPSKTFYREYAAAGIRGVKAGTYSPIEICARQLILCGDSAMPVNGDELGPKPSDWKWWKGYPGVALISGAYKSTNKIASASLHPITELWGKWTDNSGDPGYSANVSQNTTGTVVVSKYNGSFSAITDSDANQLLIQNVNNPSADASAGDLVNVSWMNGKPEGYPRTC